LHKPVKSEGPVLGLKNKIVNLLFVSFIFSAILSGCAGLSEKEQGGVFYPSLPNPPRIQYLTSFSDPRDLSSDGSGFSDFILGSEDQGATLIKKPYGVAIKDGVLYVVDIRGPGYALFDLKNKKFDVIYGSFSGKMRKPINITVDTDGTKYISDTIRSLVLVYDNKNKFLKVIGDGESFKPSDVLIAENKLIITDIKNHRIVVLDKTTDRELYTIGSVGSKQGELFFPTNLALGPDNYLYVSETGNFRVQKFTLQGEFVKSFGEVGTGLGQFARPKGVAVDREGRIHVVDAAFENVQIINKDGKLLMFYGEPGSSKANLNLPTDIFIDYDNVAYFKKYARPGFDLQYIILVSSQFGNSKVNVFGFGRMRNMDYPDEGISGDSEITGIKQASE
jgi:DNA-binding beta-propeller fold protein YncE